MVQDDDFNFEFGFVIEAPSRVVNRNRVLVWLDSSQVRYFDRRKVSILKYQHTLKQKERNFDVLKTNVTGTCIYRCLHLECLTTVHWRPFIQFILDEGTNRTRKFIRWFHEHVNRHSLIPIISTSKENMFTLQINEKNTLSSDGIGVINPLVIVHKVDCSMVNVQFLEHDSVHESLGDLWLWKGDPCFRNVYYYNHTKNVKMVIPTPSIDLLKSFKNTTPKDNAAGAVSSDNGSTAQTGDVSSDEESDFEYPFQLDDPLTNDEWVARKRLRAHTPPPEYS